MLRVMMAVAMFAAVAAMWRRRRLPWMLTTDAKGRTHATQPHTPTGRKNRRNT